MRVVVVGAGVAGCQVARELAPDHDVTVFDREGIGSGATGLSAGLVAPTLFYGDEPAIARHSNAFFREFDGTEGFSFTERDRLDFVAPEDETAARETVERLSAEGFPVAYLDVETVRDRHPYFHLDDYVGAVWYGDTGWVGPYTYATALARDATARGATVETGVEVTGLTVESGAVTGVETSEGRVEADEVVVAAGWRTTDLLPAGTVVPIRPYRTQCVVLEPESPLPDDFPLGRLSRDHFYFRPEHNGNLLIGGAPHTTDDPTSESRDADESFTLDVAEFVPSLVDGFERAGFVNGWAGIDAATPDARPIIGRPVGGPAGLVVATGFNGLGVMASPVIGPTVRAVLTGADPSFPIDPFSPDRFDVSDESFTFTSTSDV